LKIVKNGGHRFVHEENVSIDSSENVPRLNKKVMVCNVFLVDKILPCISNDLSIKINDKVIISNNSNIGIVMSTVFYTPSTIPYPLNKMKIIIRKVSHPNSTPKPKSTPENNHITQEQYDNDYLALEKKVKYWKEQLIDLSKRNRMINYKDTKRSSLKILEPDFTELFNSLAITEKELTFQYPIDKNSDIKTFSMLTLLKTLAYPISVKVGDIHTDRTIDEREKTLDNLRAKSKLAREEQGANILYLSFGFIEWKNSANEPLKSPALMMPVLLKHKSVQSPYTLSRYDEDIEINPAIYYLFNKQYGIKLPAFKLENEKSLECYMKDIEKIIEPSGWKLSREVNLGLMSFIKLSMYYDLDDNKNLKRMYKNPLIKAMINNTIIPYENNCFDADSILPYECNEVLMADSSQQEAIALSKKGISFVMQGPPGTGKSQTITNIISQALADGKSVLFVSEKAAALQVVYKRLNEAGLDKFCLALHNHKANKKAIIENIADNFNLKSTRKYTNDSAELMELYERRQFLTQYAKEIHENIPPLNKSLYEVFGELNSLKNTHNIEFNIDGLTLIESPQYHRILYRIVEYEKALQYLGMKFSDNPWKGTVVKEVTQNFKDDLSKKTEGLTNRLLSLRKKFSTIMKSFNLNGICSWTDIIQTISLFNAIEKMPLFPFKWSIQTEREDLLKKANFANAKTKEYLKEFNALNFYFDKTFFNQDFSTYLDNINQTVRNIKNIDKEFQKDWAKIIDDSKNIEVLAVNTKNQLENIICAYEKGKSILFLPFSNLDTIEHVNIFADFLNLMFKAPALRKEWFDFGVFQKTRRLFVQAHNHFITLNDKKKFLMQEWEESALNMDAKSMLTRFKIKYNSFLKIFKFSYWTDIKTVRRVSKKIDLKISKTEIAAFLCQVIEINKEILWFSDNQQLLKECFGNFYIQQLTDWEMIDSCLSCVEKIYDAFPHNIVPDDLINILYDRANHIPIFNKLSSLLSTLNKENLTLVSANISKIFSDYSHKGIREYLLPKLNYLCAQSNKLVNSIAKISAYCLQNIPNSVLIEKVPQVIELNKTYNVLEKLYGDYQDFFGENLKGLETNWDLIIFNLKSITEFFAMDGVEKITEKFISMFCDNSYLKSEIYRAKNDLQYHIAQTENSYSAFKNLFEQSPNIDNTDVGEIATRVNDCISNIATLEKWISYTEKRNSCNEIGLEDFTKKIEAYDNTLKNIVDIFKKRFFTLWIQAVIDGKKIISHYLYQQNHNEDIERFVWLDKRQAFIARQRIKQNIIKGIRDWNENIIERTILNREASKSKRIMPLRELFKSIPNLLLKLKPCMMMSPLSVAYFLDAQSYNFDMVIFDEASQIFPQDAIGSIFRGRQVIIAGDTKQLPPTNFFTINTDNEEDLDRDDEEFVETESYDSILEETAGVLPNSTLLWHYRSKYEDLIAFSNQKIYENKLITFPSNINNGKDIGVEFVFVKDGIYEGKGRNLTEALRCVELVKEHIEKTPQRSLGIIAFSKSQQEIIAQEIQKFREKNRKYESFFEEGKEGEFFVKNLENVQGDERDTIIFSVSYGKTKEQKDKNQPMHLRFGPLGQKRGERRLNVAITRAKSNIKLVSSVFAQDIDLSHTQSEGIKMLCQYIEFARNRSADVSIPQSENDEDKFLDSVADFLISKGYKIKKYVGCSGYKIDVAIVHPQDDNCFVAGIECDGHSYSLAKSARDRDHLRKSVLESMGWQIYRIWSLEWTMNPVREKNNLLTFIETAIKEFIYDKKNEIR
jgi:very-short-patch-repair endonuclease